MRETSLRARTVAAAGIGILLGACTCGRPGTDVDSAAAALDLSPVERPVGWVYEVAVGDPAEGGDARLASLRARLPEGSLRALFPSRVADVLDRVFAVPAPLADRIEEGSPLRCIAVRPDPDTTRTACAVRLSPGDDVPGLVPGAPLGASWVGDLPIAIAGDLLVAGQDREVVERSLAWLASMAMRTEEASALRVTLAEEVSQTVLRPIADNLTTSYARGARRQVEDERAAHAGPPALGEPEALIAALESVARERAALLPDLGAITITLDPTSQGLMLLVSAGVEGESPLAAWLDAMPAGAPWAMRAIPRGTVLAWLSSASAEERGRIASDTIEAITPIAGARLPDADRARFTQAITAWAGARGERSIAAIGLGPGGLWAALGSDGASPLSLAPLAEALATPWSQTLIAERLGCESLAVGVETREGDDASISLCPRARVASSQAGQALAVSLEGVSPPAVSPQPASPERSAAEPVQGPSIAHALAAALETGSSGLGGSVDLDRDLGALGEPIFLAILAPSLLARALDGSSGLDVPAHAPLAMVAVSYSEGTLGIQLRASTAAIGELVPIVELLGAP